jgi:hypothetical protein
MDALDRLPLDVLIALQELMVAPDGEAKERARLRAADAGYYLVAMAGKRADPEPIPLEEAPDDLEAIRLTFG